MSIWLKRIKWLLGTFETEARQAFAISLPFCLVPFVMPEYAHHGIGLLLLGLFLWWGLAPVLFNKKTDR